MSSTLLLNPVTWDLVVDINGNIAVATAPYQLAQDAASQIRTFLGEVFYDTSQGVQWWNILGKALVLPFLKSQLQSAAETVPGVASATCYISSFTNRNVTGQVQVTSEAGGVFTATFNVSAPIPGIIPQQS